MTYETKPGTGALFKNEQKKSDKHPDYRGNITDMDGTKWDIAAWLQKSKGGKTYMSLKLSEPFEKRADRPKDAELDDEIPF